MAEDALLRPLTKVASALTSFSWIHQNSPGFAVNADKIDVLQEPEDFYMSLKVRNSLPWFAVCLFKYFKREVHVFESF